MASDATWCCVPARPLLISRLTPRFKSKEPHTVQHRTGTISSFEYDKLQLPLKASSDQRIADSCGECHENYYIVDNRPRSGELTKSGDVLKTEEIATLIKQSFISGRGVEQLGANEPPFRVRFSSGRVSPVVEPTALGSICNTNGARFNSFGITDLQKPASPPVEKSKDSPTLYEMIVHERELPSRPFIPQRSQMSGKTLSSNIRETLLIRSSRANQFNDSSSSLTNQFNNSSSSDVKLMLSNKAGVNITLNVHRHILTSHSRYFAAKLSERWSTQQRSLPYLVEISDCEDLELYMETLRLMYCGDLKRKLMKESVSRILGILKVATAIVFEAGVLACLEHLEAAPWAEEDDENVRLTLSQLQLDSLGTGDVLKRLSMKDPISSEDILVSLLHVVTRGTDDKARREMKNLISRMLRENAARVKDSIDVSKESLYISCHACLDSFSHLFTQASTSDFLNSASEDKGLLMAQMSRQADNVHWLTEILIDRQIAEDFVRMWASQTELAALHSQIPTIFRYEVSRLTARLCIALGKGQVLVPEEVRIKLIQIWLEPLINDFAWMQRACKGLDRKIIEEGLSKTILTLPLRQQQNIMMAWLDRFLKNGDNCPNLQMAFEVWWRRTFVRPCVESPAYSVLAVP